MVKQPDSDLLWVLGHVEIEADLCSVANGSQDESTIEARRLETVVKRLAREAGYEVEG